MSAHNAFISGLIGRCPNCGKGPLFTGFIKVRPLCQTCGFDLSKADSGDGPAVFILLIVGAIGCAGLLVSEIAWSAPIWLALLIWIPAIAVLSLAAMRPFKGLLVAAQFHFRASEHRSE